MDFNYNFGFAQKGLSQAAFDMMDVNKDGKISKEEENLFDQTMIVKYGATEEEVLIDALKKQVELFKGGDKAGSSRGAEWITDETEREAYLFNIERSQNNKSFKNMPAAYQRTHDGELTAADNQFLLEIDEMNAIANEFLNANSQYVVFENAGGLGLVDTIRDLFDAFTAKNKNRTKDIEKMSDEFKLELQKITGNSMANVALNELTRRGDRSDTYLRWATEDANRDGVVTDKESKEIQAATVDALMSRALRGEDVEGILKGLLESTSDTKLKKELIQMAKQLSELAGQRYLNKPEAFFNKLNTLATNMVNKLSGKGVADSVNDAQSNRYDRQLENKKLHTKFSDGAYYRPYGGNSSRDLFAAAINRKDEAKINELAQGMCNWLKSIGKCDWNVNDIKEILRAMPANTNLDDFCNNDTGLGYAIQMNKFVKFFNETIDNMQTLSVDAGQIDFAADDNLQIASGKDGLIKSLQTDSDFYTQKVNANTAKATINGIKGQIKSMAENAYLLKGLEFNQKLFDKCFSSASSTVLAELDKGNGASLNSILNKFVNAFNSEWVGQSLADIAEKSK